MKFKAVYVSKGFKIGDSCGFQKGDGGYTMPVLAEIIAIAITEAKVFLGENTGHGSRHNGGSFPTSQVEAVFGVVARKFSVSLPFGGSYEFQTQSYEQVLEGCDYDKDSAQVIEYNVDNRGNRISDEQMKIETAYAEFDFPSEKEVLVASMKGCRFPVIRNNATGQTVDTSDWFRQNKQIYSYPTVWLCENINGKSYLKCSSEISSEAAL